MPGEDQVGYQQIFLLRRSGAAVAQLPKEVVKSLSLKVFKNYGDVVIL